MTVTSTDAVLVEGHLVSRDSDRREYRFSRPIFGGELAMVGQELLRQLGSGSGSREFSCQSIDDASFIAERWQDHTWANLEFTWIFPCITQVIQELLHTSVNLPDRWPY